MVVYENLRDGRDEQNDVKSGKDIHVDETQPGYCRFFKFQVQLNRMLLSHGRLPHYSPPMCTNILCECPQSIRFCHICIAVLRRVVSMQNDLSGSLLERLVCIRCTVNYHSFLGSTRLVCSYNMDIAR